jgi:menaquinol-cytochrome c reductase iron-sulfur subunit
MPETVVCECVEVPEVEEGAYTRRRFLGLASGALTAIIAAGLGVPLARLYVGNVFRQKATRWLKLGGVAEVRPEEPQLFHSSYIDLDGWRQTTRRVTAYAVTHDGKEFTVFANACTHLGCPVHWDDHVHEFVCPCHGGGFTIDGRVSKGPPPRPLDRLEHKIEGGVLYIKVAEA